MVPVPGSSTTFKIRRSPTFAVTGIVAVDAGSKERTVEVAALLVICCLFWAI